ncbi:unnamed protein product [Caenorhabditis sp. 36 PRJEB53466]|nr:unnamed protein product [Caenorhabditis sp. 36 PRJEB53466]
MRFTRIPFGINASPFILGASITLYLYNKPAPINKAILRNLYVDNVLFTTNNEDETNSQKTTEMIPEEDRAPKKPNKILGHYHDAEKDTITIEIPEPPAGWPNKAGIHAFLAKIYDPMGMVSPITVRIKLFSQSLWETKVGWKSKIPKNTLPIWEEIKKLFTHTQFSMPRQMTERYDYNAIKLVIFSDASKHHYGIAAYLRYTFPDNSYTSRLLFSKSKVKPLKDTERYTIPRLELMALTIATSNAVFLQEAIQPEVKIQSVELFSDSMVALGWTTTDKKLKTFVSNLVKQIKDNCKKLQDNDSDHCIHYCPTDMNPADLTTRGKSTEELFKSDLWFHGPEFLRKAEDTWPQKWTGSATIPKFLTKEMEEEMTGKQNNQNTKKDENETEHLINVATTTKSEQTREYESFVPYESTNSLSKLTRLVSNVMKAATLFQKKSQHEWRSPILKKFAEAKTGLEEYNDHDRSNTSEPTTSDHYTSMDYMDGENVGS